MTIEITGETEQLIRAHLRGGDYTSPEQVVEAAVRQLQQRPENGGSPPPQPRQGGYWHGRVIVADDFDELPPDLQEAFGVTGP